MVEVNESTHEPERMTTVEVASNLHTHASSSASTDDISTAHLYDIRANREDANLDSSLVRNDDFKVTTASANGLDLAEGDISGLYKTVNSTQSANDVAASAEEVSNVFITYTCSQNFEENHGTNGVARYVNEVSGRPCC